MTAESLRASATDLLRDWAAPDAGQDALRHTYLAYLDAVDDACLRSCASGHLTASAIVFDAAAGHVLLTLHPRVGAWVQLGGHCETTDTTMADAARREAREESGIADLELTGGLVEIHTHPITCSLGVPTRHLDLRFCAVADGSGRSSNSGRDGAGGLPEIVRSDESVDLAWWPVTGLPDQSARTGINDLVRLGRTALSAN